MTDHDLPLYPSDTILTHSCGHLALWRWDPRMPADELAAIMAVKRCPWCGGDSGEIFGQSVEERMPDYFTIPGLGVCRRLPTEEEVLDADPR